MPGKLAALLSGTPKELMNVFGGLRKGKWYYDPDPRPELADKLIAFVASGSHPEVLMNLSQDDIVAIDRQCLGGGYNWDGVRALAPLVVAPGKLTSEQWVRLGQVYAVCPQKSFDPTRWSAVPLWFVALQECRQNSVSELKLKDHESFGSEIPVWNPQFLRPVLEAGQVPADQVPRAILEGFFAGFTTDHSWNKPWRSAWENRDTVAARGFLQFVKENIALVPMVLARATAAVRIETLWWLGLYPDLLPQLVPMLSDWASAPAKTVREATIELVKLLPAGLRWEMVAGVIDQGTPANLNTMIDFAGRGGEPGRAVLEQALSEARGGKRDEMLAAALNRSQVTAAVPETTLEIPPVPPVDTTKVGEDFVATLQANVARWITSLEDKVAHPKYEWEKNSAARDLAFARGLGTKDYQEIRAWLNGEAGRPKSVYKFPQTFFQKLPFLAAVRYAGKNWWLLDSLLGGYDLRTLAEAERLAGTQDAVSWIPSRIYGWERALDKLDLDKVWPFFAEHPDYPDMALGIIPVVPGSFGQYDPDVVGVTLQILGGFPTLPVKYLPPLAQIATSEAKTDRRAAQDLLSGQPGIVDIAARALGNGKAEVRAASAAWIGRIGDPAGIEPLRQALAKEKREQPQAAMLNALSVLGDDISEHLTPQVMAATAKKGLAGKLPAGMDWFPLDALPGCSWADGTPVAPEIIRWWAVLAVKLKDPLGAGLIPIYVGLLDQPSREDLGSFVLDAWIAHDTSNPSDAVCREYAAAQVDSRYRNYQEWFKRSLEWYKREGAMTKDQVFEELRREKASEYLGSAIGEKGLLALSVGAPGHQVFAAVQRYIRDHGRRRAQVEALITAAAGNPDPSAIQLVLSVAHKFKQETVRLKANELAEQIAERNGWTMDELADRTIPTAGFEDSGLLSLDFGPRSFTGRIARSPNTGAFTIEVFNADGKKITALPKPGQSDNAELAAESRKQLTTSKKELSQIVALQTSRLFEAMCLGWSWNAADWRDYLLAHPVMRHLVSTLVWKAWDEGRPGSYILFRPTADGELLNSDDDAITLPDTDQVSLAHLATITAAEADAWRAHLADYQVEPLFGQFQATVPPVDPDVSEINDHLGWLSDSFAIRGRANKRGFNRGQAEDGGWFSEYFKDLPGAKLRVIIEFTGSILPEEQMPAAIKQLVFEQQGRRLTLGDVPPILLAESYADYVYIAEAGAFDPGWESKSGF